MSKTINVKDLILISDYIDGRLSAPAMERLSTRVSDDPEFRQAFQEITYTRAMLRALPHKRAPRNFTLSQDKYRKPVRNGWLQPAFSFVSIASAVALVVTFGSSYLLGGGARMSAAPAMESDFLAAPMSESATEATPMILNWNPNVANGMGGGGGDPQTSGVYTGGDGIGGAGGPGWITVEPIPNTDGTDTDPMEGSGGGAPGRSPAFRGELADHRSTYRSAYRRGNSTYDRSADDRRGSRFESHRTPRGDHIL